MFKSGNFNDFVAKKSVHGFLIPLTFVKNVIETLFLPFYFSVFLKLCGVKDSSLAQIQAHSGAKNDNRLM